MRQKKAAGCQTCGRRRAVSVSRKRAAFFIATAGLVLAEVVDPVMAQAILAAITGA